LEINESLSEIEDNFDAFGESGDENLEKETIYEVKKEA
jgi:hypothetical protein